MASALPHLSFCSDCFFRTIGVRKTGHLNAKPTLSLKDFKRNPPKLLNQDAALELLYLVIGSCIVKSLVKLSGLLCLVAAILTSAPLATEGQSATPATQIREYWIDPSTGLMWTAKDNGKDISWKKAAKYCRNLRLEGYSDWRLPNMAELQPLYDSSITAPGLAGYAKKLRPVTWHVRGQLFLTGDQWSSNYREDDRGHYSGYAYYFDFNSGQPNDEEGSLSTGRRALCVRGSKK
jgi:Protein of unknown function (DUF1566)